MDVVHDFNGDFYVVGSSGEIEELLDHHKVLIYQQDAGVFGLNQILDTNTAANHAPVIRTLKLNYWYLRSLPDVVRPIHVDAWKIAYLRVLALCKGFGDPQNNIAAHKVRYSDIIIVPNNHHFDTRDPDDTAVTGSTGAMAEVIDDWGEDASLAWRNQVRKKLSNIICLIAFFMRTRGHHWTEDMEVRFVEIWKRCLYNEDDPNLKWKYIARHSLHFIYPDTLDAAWYAFLERARCNGALVKRWSSFAAGTAAIGACLAGANDVTVVFPKIRDVIPQAFAELDRCVAVLNADRWAGSINRRFYGGRDLVINERALGALAATILAALKVFESTAALARSPALIRIAQNAPITGELIAVTLQKAAQDKRMINAILLEGDEEE